MDIANKNFSSPWVLCCLISLIIGMAPYAKAKDEAGLPKLSWGEGFLLVDLDINVGTAVLTLEGRRQRRTQVGLVANNGRWMLKALPRGEYQIIDVKVPYFDLPHRILTKDNPGWKIKIQAGRVNYIGRIEIAKERTEDYISVTKLNRLVSDYENIKTDLNALIAIYPLADGHNVRDDFVASLLEKEINNE